jgi:hypothetical protein
MAQGNQALYIAAGVGVLWWLGVFDGMFAADGATAKVGTDAAANIVPNQAPATEAGKAAVGSRSQAVGSQSSDALRNAISYLTYGAVEPVETDVTSRLAPRTTDVAVSPSGRRVIS